MNYIYGFKVIGNIPYLIFKDEEYIKELIINDKIKELNDFLIKIYNVIKPYSDKVCLSKWISEGISFNLNNVNYDIVFGTSILEDFKIRLGKTRVMVNASEFFREKSVIRLLDTFELRIWMPQYLYKLYKIIKENK